MKPSRILLVWSLSVLSFVSAVAPATAQVTKNGYTFIDVKSPTDPTFTQLLGLNDGGVIAGYFGCGTVPPLPNHPNKGFSLVFINSKNGPFTGTPAFTAVNFPGSVQTQNIGINNLPNPTMAGFWQDAKGVDHGYVLTTNTGTFVTIDAPGTGTFGNQLLGIDDNNNAAGFNTNAQGTMFAETEMPFPTGPITNLPLATLGVTLPIGNSTASGINLGIVGTVAAPGFTNLISGFNQPTGTTSNAFVIHTPNPAGRRVGAGIPIASNLPHPGGSTFVQAFGVSKNAVAVGTYMDLNGIMHGFTFSLKTGIFTTVDHPNALQQPGFGTTINGINALGQIVGFYTNGVLTNPGCQDTIGFVATPRANPPPAPLFGAVSPGSRTVPAGTGATIFASMINTSATTLTNCEPELPSNAPTTLTMSYAPTDPRTNFINGPLNTPVSIPPGATASFLLDFDSNVPLKLPSLPILMGCANVDGAPTIPGVTTIDLNFTPASSPLPDMITISVTDPATPGICTADFTNNQAGAFAVATINNGATGRVTVTPVTGNVGLPLSAFAVCQTDPRGQCLSALSSSLTLNVPAKATLTFSVFMSVNNAIPFAPGASRVGLNFTDPATGAVLGSTNVAMQAN